MHGDFLPFSAAAGPGKTPQMVTYRRLSAGSASLVRVKLLLRIGEGASRAGAGELVALCH
jgi:hypothetical protein